MSRGTIFSVQRFSVHDGPGIRTTVFLKGCPLRCPWCQNPEGLERGTRLWNFGNLCVGCGDCVQVCPVGALRMGADRIPVLDHDVCVRCGECIRECPENAMAMDGWQVTAAELAETLLADRIFFNASGGGVTFSGGEPLGQVDFVRDVAERCRAAGVETAVETCLEVPWEAVEAVIPVITYFQVDCKLADGERHRRATGVTNDRILRNIRRLAALVPVGNIIIRLPLIPGYTDDEENILAVAELVRDVNPDLVLELMNFNPLAETKYRRMAAMNAFPSGSSAYRADEMDAFRQLARRVVRDVR